MTPWHRASVNLRHALTTRILIHPHTPPLPTSTSLYSTTISSQPKTPRKPRTAKTTTTESPPLAPQQLPTSWITFNTASAQMDKMIFEEEQDYKSKTDVELDEKKWPKPSEIPWQPKVENCVNLIGHVKMPVQFKVDVDGKRSWAESVIRQEISPKSNPLWIPVLFEGDLAHVVACHVKVNDYVYVTGHLSAEPSPFNLSTTTHSLQLMAESINFVDESSRLKKYVSQSKPISQSKSTHQPSMEDVTQSWRDLLLKPQEWWDIRSDKENSTRAAFKRKTTGELLFIDELTPLWLLREIDSLTFDQQMTGTKQQAASGKIYDASLGPWKDLLDDANLWQDYRKDKLDGKVSAKHPDFKRKDGSVPLWLNTAPKYILPELDNLDFGVPHQTSTPQKTKRSKGEESWKDLVENPHQWMDNRSNKKSQKFPDFKHKVTGEGLWLDSAPKTILSALENVDFGVQTSVRAKIVKGKESWKDVVENPKNWWDNRFNKLNNKGPDFKHKDTGEVLWLSSAPGWVRTKLPPSKATPSFGSQIRESMI